MKIIATVLATIAIFFGSGIAAAQKAPTPSGSCGTKPETKSEAPRPEVNRKKAKVPKKRKARSG